MRLLATLIALLSLALTAAPATASHPLCQPDPTTRATLDAVGSVAELSDLSPDEKERRIALVEAALAAHPDALFLHKWRLAALVLGPSRPRILEEYATLRKEHPDDPLYDYLRAHTSREPEVWIEASVAALEKDPDFPWAHLRLATALVWAERAGAPPEPGEADESRSALAHLVRFEELCPDRIAEILSTSKYVADDAWWRERIPGFRERIRRDPAAHLEALPRLWALDFRLAERSRYGEVRRRVARDLTALEEALEIGEADRHVDERDRLSVLLEGYELAGLDEKALAVEATLRERFPCSSHTPTALLKEVDASLSPELPQERRAAAALELVPRTRRMAQRCSGDRNASRAHLRVLDQLGEPATAELVATGERAAEAYGKAMGASTPSVYTEVAHLFIDHGVALDRALELLELARAEVLAALAEEERDLDPLTRHVLLNQDLLAARARIAAGETAAAERALDEIGQSLNELDPGEGAQGQMAQMYAIQENCFWAARAELAERTGRSADALAYLLRAADTGAADASGWHYGWAHGPDRDEARSRAAALWAELGGAARSFAALEGREAVAGVIAEVSPWSRIVEPFPGFELEDLAGKRWTVEELRGKAVFVNAWASWCAPCRQELPFIQALHERLAKDEDALVVTLNADSNRGAAARVIDREGYTFPVLLAEGFLPGVLEGPFLPQSWILDTEGAALYHQSGFGGTTTEKEWLADVEALLDEAAKADG